MALAKNLELDRVIVGNVDEAVEEHEVIAEAEAHEVLLNGVVPRNLWVTKEREKTLEFGILRLGRTDVADELWFVGGIMDGDCRELKLVGLEKRARRRVGCFTPL